MDVLAFRDYCLSLPFTEECTPFDETTLVYKVGGRMYAFADMVGFERIALKCDPEYRWYHGHYVRPVLHWQNGANFLFCQIPKKEYRYERTAQGL